MVQTQFPLSGGIKGVKAYNTKKEKKYNVTSKPLCTFSTFWEKFPLEMTLEEQESAGGADIGRSIEKLLMWLIGHLNLYKLQQSWELTFLKLYHDMNKKWGIKLFFTLAVLGNCIFKIFT